MESKSDSIYIDCHDDFGITVCETPFDSIACYNGKWFYIDDEGYLTSPVEVH